MSNATPEIRRVLVIHLWPDATITGGVMRVPGGRPGLWLVAMCGFMATAVSLVLVFIPRPAPRTSGTTKST
jgi:hypothetical protein